tara:strand:- start:1513 stop:1626 length:114 start_codon:yes stop_codon:yes gene_type:complete
MIFYSQSTILQAVIGFIGIAATGVILTYAFRKAPKEF